MLPGLSCFIGLERSLALFEQRESLDKLGTEDVGGEERDMTEVGYIILRIAHCPSLLLLGSCTFLLVLAAL